MQGLATLHPWMAFDPETGLPNELAAEQYLAADIGAKIEMQTERPRGISVVRLEELLRAVLHSEAIDETWSGDRQLKEFLDATDSYVAVTHGGRHERLLPRVDGLNAIVKSLTRSQEKR